MNYSQAIATTLYQWTDANGVLTYSPTPPPESITLNFKKINTQDHISKPQQKAETTPAVKTQTTDIKKAPLQTSQQEPVNVDQIRKDRHCLEMNQNIAALETRLTHAKSTDEVNKTMLHIEKYQSNIRETCSSSR